MPCQRWQRSFLYGHPCVLSHMLLGVDLEDACQADAEANEPPADHCGMQGLAAVQIGEAVHHLNCDGAARRKAAMSRPKAYGLGSNCPHALHDEIQRLITTCAAPVVRAAIFTNLGVQQSPGLAENLVGAAATHAKEALTVGILLVTADGLELAAFNLDQHSAKIHGTHGPDNFCVVRGHGHLPAHAASGAILSEMG